MRSACGARPATRWASHWPPPISVGSPHGRAGSRTPIRLFEDAARSSRRIGADAFVAETNARIAECLVLEGRYQEANELAAETLREAGAEEPGVLAATLERLLGYAAVQGRKPADEAQAHFERSLEHGRAVNAQYEVALTLVAQAETGLFSDGDPSGEGRAILESLGVASVPSPPLP